MMKVNPQTKTLRAKKLGVLIQDARQAAGKTKKECAKAIGIPNATLGAFERGAKSPSLSRLEILAFYLGVPITHFWGNEAISEKPHPINEMNLEETLRNRNQAIADQLRAAREEASISVKDLAKMVGITPRRLRNFESGKDEIPLPELDALVLVLDKSIDAFRDQKSQIGDWITEKDDVSQFLELPANLREFVSKPINHPYVELAKKLSEMPADKLRAIAEGLLEITL